MTMPMTRRLGLGLLAASMLMAGPAAARDPQAGSWQSVRDGSYWSTGDFPASFSLRIDLMFEGGKLIYHSVNDSDKAKVGVLDFTVPTDGSVHPIAGQARYNQVSVNRISDSELHVLQLKDGDVIVASFYTFAPDGKSFVRNGVGKSPEGKSKAYREVFAKQ